MAGKRQPTDLVKANGRKHLSSAEEEARRDREVHVPPANSVEPPDWFPKKTKLKAEYREIAEVLMAAGLFSELDRDVLAQYFVARERWLEADSEAARAIKAAAKAEAMVDKLSAKAAKRGADLADDDEGEDAEDERAQAEAAAAEAAKRAKDWASVQNTYFRQARQCAETMGLSVSARCRIQVPEAVINAGKAAAAGGEETDEFTRRLNERQARAGSG